MKLEASVPPCVCLGEKKGHPLNLPSKNECRVFEPEAALGLKLSKGGFVTPAYLLDTLLCLERLPVAAKSFAMF